MKKEQAQGETNLEILLASMQPTLNAGAYVFCSLANPDVDWDKVLFFFREKEGLTIVCDQKTADDCGFSYASVFAWITLEVHSSLDAVGLTAAFSSALANNGISCNVVAGFYHDHIFVHYQQKDEAILVLKNLANGHSNQ